MRIHESEGVRTYRRDLRSVRIALAVKSVMGGLTERYLSEVVRAMDWSADSSHMANYQATQRAMPFEIGGMVYSVQSETPQTRAYQKSKNVVARPGKLEDYAPKRERQASSVDKRIEAKVAELAQWTNVFALREEAKKYIEAMEARFEARLSTIENRLTMLWESITES